ncbi:MAG TPA: alpha/beta hydrolase [Candidatus Limnocylindria bacterium]|nr:alpha/beta hydrolase [Candidatus Limnocylindria bacterium]
MVLDAASWNPRFAELPGRGRMRYYEWPGPVGAPAVVLLHGLAATGRLNWATSAPALARHFRVVVVDHRGHGQGIRTHHFRLADCADDVVALADLLGIESFVGVGYSMGGPIAKLCWHRHRDRVRGLVLCATARHFMRREAKAVLAAVIPGMVLGARAVPDFFRARIVEAMLRDVPPGPRRDFARAEMMATDPATVFQAARAVIRFSSRDWVSNIDVPTAVVVTTRDRLVPPASQYKLARAIGGAKVFEVDGDHLACVRAADTFVDALIQACTHVTAVTTAGQVA